MWSGSIPCRYSRRTWNAIVPRFNSAASVVIAETPKKDNNFLFSENEILTSPRKIFPELLAQEDRKKRQRRGRGSTTKEARAKRLELHAGAKSKRDPLKDCLIFVFSFDKV